MYIDTAVQKNIEQFPLNWKYSNKNYLKCLENIQYTSARLGICLNSLAPHVLSTYSEDNLHIFVKSLAIYIYMQLRSELKLVQSNTRIRYIRDTIFIHYKLIKFFVVQCTLIFLYISDTIIIFAYTFFRIKLILYTFKKKKINYPRFFLLQSFFASREKKKIGLNTSPAVFAVVTPLQMISVPTILIRFI